MTYVVSLIADDPTPDEISKFSIMEAALYLADGKSIRFEGGVWKLFINRSYGQFRIGTFTTLADAEAAGDGGFVMQFEDYVSEPHGSSRFLRKGLNDYKIYGRKPLRPEEPIEHEFSGIGTPPCVSASSSPVEQISERRAPALANEAVAREALWGIFLSSLTAEEREEVESLPPESKSGALHRWVVSTTGSGGALGDFEGWVNRLATQ